MSKEHYIGIMSGTSLDGLDLAKVKFTKENESWKFILLEGKTTPFPTFLYQPLQNCMNLSALDLIKLDKQLGKFIGDQALSFNLESVDAIASHGHTIFHEPHNGITHQIGSINEIHATTLIPVIGDFRSLDVALGGQGAPLVPVGDSTLFSQYNATLNFGGISNITLLNKKLSAHDVCPLNQVSNYICQKHFDCEYDKNGGLGKKGEVNQELLSYFENFSYYGIEGPKSLGKEDIDSYFITKIDQSNLPPASILRTYYEHTSNIIAEELIKNSVKKTLCTGGGVFNSYLIKLISNKIKNQSLDLVLPSKDTIEFKEAIIFAFLGLLRGLGENNIYKEVTGAKRDSSSGLMLGKNPF